MTMTDEAKKRLEFLEGKLEDYLRFPEEHPESNEEHRMHKMTVLVPQLRRAIEKCKEGTFRICDDCGGEIGEDRLRVVITATRCVKCEEVREIYEFLERKSADPNYEDARTKNIRNFLNKKEVRVKKEKVD